MDRCTIPLVVLAALSVVGWVHRPAVRQQQAQPARPLARTGARGARDIRATSFGAGFVLSTGRARDRDRRHRVRRARCTATGSTPTATTRPSNGSVGSPRCSRNAYYLDVGRRAVRERPDHGRSPRFLSEGVDHDVIDGAVNGIGRGVPRRAAAACAGCRPDWCATTRSAIVLGAVLLLRVRDDEGDVVMRRCSAARAVCRTSSKLGFPLLTSSSSCPRSARCVTLLMPARRPELDRARRLRHRAWRRSGWRSSCSSQFDTSHAKPATSSSSDHSWMPALGIRWIARRRRHQPVHGGAHHAADPDRAARVGRSSTKPKSFIVLDAAARVGDDRRVPRARLDRVLHVLRVRARADVLPHRGVGPRQPPLRGDEVLPLHDDRLGVPVRGHPLGRVPAPARHRTMLTFDVRILTDWASSAHSTVGHHGQVAVPRVRGRVRGQGPARSRSTRGCPTRTPTRRPRARSCWPA